MTTRNYSLEDKYACVATFYLTGEWKETSRQTGIPEATIRGWSKTEWWADILEKVIADVSARLRSKGTRIVDMATDAVLERLENGDEVLDKRGAVIRRKVSLKDALWASLTWFDKTKVINEMGNRFGKQSLNAQELMNEMVSIAQKSKAVKEEAIAELPSLSAPTPPSEKSTEQ